MFRDIEKFENLSYGTKVFRKHNESPMIFIGWDQEGRIKLVPGVGKYYARYNHENFVVQDDEEVLTLSLEEKLAELNKEIKEAYEYLDANEDKMRQPAIIDLRGRIAGMKMARAIFKD